MNYLEIIEWIEEHVTTIGMESNNYLEITWFDKLDNVWSSGGKDLISIVLEINNKELIK